jgi:hypothetical protein
LEHYVTIAKSKIVRPYAPDYVDKVTLAYRLCVSESSVDKLVSEGRLPPPHDVFGFKRWKWEEVEARIAGNDETVSKFVERLCA